MVEVTEDDLVTPEEPAAAGQDEAPDAAAAAELSEDDKTEE